MLEDGIHERVRAAAGERTNRVLAELTGASSKTIRRYMAGQAPSVDFLCAFCKALDINGDWLLTGRGPMKNVDVKHHALGEARAADLLGAMAGSIETLIDRVDRMQKYVQTLETRVRAGAAAGVIDALTAEKNTGPKGDEHAHVGPPPGEKRAGASRADQARQRAQRIADAIAGRPHPDAH